MELGGGERGERVKNERLEETEDALVVGVG